MKIAIATVQVPFITGGAEILVENLRDELKKRKHEAEIVAIPFKWYPSETLLNCMIIGRMIDLTEVNGEKIDLVIAMKFPAYFLKHENKVIWLIHQHRQAYDLWDTEYGDISLWEDGVFIRNTVIKNDTKYLREAKNIFTIADNVTERLKKYNKINALTLYPPPRSSEKFCCKAYQDFIFYPSRIDKMKRQRLLIKAVRYLKSDTKIYIAGKGNESEMKYLHSLIDKYNLKKNVKLLGYISEEEKIDYYSKSLATYFGAYDEDYGYVTLESFLSKKSVIVHDDAGGPLEFVENTFNGFVISDNPKSIAKKIDLLAHDRALAKKMGENGFKTITSKNINWDFVIDRLLR